MPDVDWEGVAQEADEQPFSHLQEALGEIEHRLVGTGGHVNTYVLLVSFDAGDYRITFKGNRFMALGMMEAFGTNLSAEAAREMGD